MSEEKGKAFTAKLVDDSRGEPADFITDDSFGGDVATESPAKSPPSRRPTFSDPERAREAQLKSAEARKRNREKRDRDASFAHLTGRQKMGIALAELSLEDLRAVRDSLLDGAKKGDARSVHALVRLYDQAYGRAQEEAPADGRDAEEKAWEEMSPAERAAYRAALIEQVEKERGHSLPSGKTEDPRVTNE